MDDHRKFPRVQEEADVTVCIQSSPEALDLEGRIFSCNSYDVSLGGVMLVVDIPVPVGSLDVTLGGVMLVVDIPVPVGSLLELEIVFNHSSERYWHIGNVVWVGEVEGSPDWYHIGIRFDTAKNPQFSSWQSAVSKLIEKSKED